MVIWWILGVLLLLIVLLLCLRVGVEASWGEKLQVQAKIGPVKIALLPRREKKTDEKKPAEAKPDVKKKSSEVESAKEWVKPTFADIKEAFPMLCGALLRALNKTRHSIRINPMQCSITFGGDDPVAITQAYGWANTVVWTAMPQLERVIDIPAPYIHLESDFQSPATHFEGKLGISFRVGDLIRIGLTAGIPALRWYLALQKKTKPATTAQTA